MSTTQNQEWLEAAMVNFEEALEASNYEMCKAIIADTREVGFNSEADEMEEQLGGTDIASFV